MRRLDWYLGSLLLGAALIAPVGIQAKDKDKEHNCPASGYYDRDRKDCHNWDDHESRTYPNLGGGPTQNTSGVLETKG